ncbi:MAG TPA: hypothetical protein DD490_05100, partial [Acidobacteria bacterium]|nr:hypothetical protein [Acidobacteriota bacterium]
GGSESLPGRSPILDDAIRGGGEGDFLRSRSRGFDVEPAVGGEGGDRRAGHVLHGEPGTPVRRGAAVEQAGDVRVGETGQDAPFMEDSGG